MSNSSIEAEISEKGKLIYTNRGTSMLPLIREGKDMLILERPSFPLRKYDVPLYKPEPFHGKYVLHRIIRVRDGLYTLRGDNRIACEENVREDEIVGVLTGVIRSGGKTISVSSFSYKLYSRIWHYLFPVRYLFMRARSAARRIFRFLKRSTRRETP
jgi:hypothetical protein